MDSKPLNDPYSVLSKIYDQVMSHVNYDLWVEHLTQILYDHGLPLPDGDVPVSLLECACGTGNITARLAALGFTIDAFDSSSGMIDQARKKMKNFKVKPHLWVDTFQDYQPEHQYDAVICIYDSVNYLLKEEELVDFFQKVKIALKPRGLLIFDICTIANSLQHFSNRIEYERGRDFRFQRRMVYRRFSRIQENHFEIWFDETGETSFWEVHRQKIYRQSEIIKCLRKAALVVIEKSCDFQRQQTHRNALRIHYCCRKRNLPFQA